MPEARYRLGCDIGGTFTDFVLLDERTGDVHVHKCLTTPSDPSDAIAEGIRGLGEKVPGFTAALSEVIHGTTLVINAIIERKGARTGLLTTEGFRDVLELGREIRYAPYDVFAEFPRPLVPRELRREVRERVRADGQVLTPLDLESARTAVLALIADGVESFAVCLLNSFENPTHERQVAEIVRDLAPGRPVSISVEVLPQIREYERTSTTVTNAYVKPLTDRYLHKLAARLQSLGASARLFIMLSSGGITSVETAARFPVRIIESGPTAAVIAAEHYGRRFSVREMFCFDMGGTTAKSCLIQGGKAGVVPTFEVGRVQRFMRGSGLPIQVPVVDLMEIGAGGGSIARISRMGTLRVGPDSAGAEPGPICYGRGGTEPTVTDADLLLGYLDADYFLGGQMKLDRESARRGLGEKIASPLGVTLEQAAFGIHDLIDETMAAAAKTHIAERGGNPKLVTVAVFGGGGPVHAWGLARKLGAPRLLVPPNAGVGSALGFFTAPRAFDVVRSHKVTLGEADLGALEALFSELEHEARQALSAADEEVTYARSIDARFVGQGAETNLPLGGLDLRELTKDAIRERFDGIYARLYGRTYPDFPLELVHFRVRASLPERPAFSPEAGGFVEHRVYDRYRLPSGAELEGPAIVEERESTLVIGPGGRARLDARGFLWVDLPGSA